MAFGSYEINVNTSGMPQKVASAFFDVTSKLIGAKYDFAAYLGSQVANGTNHAIVAKQTVITGVDHYNVVLMVLNEKAEGFTLVNIVPILEGGEPLGGTKIQVSTELPEDAQNAFDRFMTGFVGSYIKPILYLGSQLVNGTNYYFLVESKMILAPNGFSRANDPSIDVLRTNPKLHTFDLQDVLAQ